MKKLLFLLVMFSFYIVAPAKAQLKLGVTGGLNISMLHMADDDYKGYVDKKRPGILIGPTAIYALPISGLGVDASVLYDLRAAKSKENKATNTIYCTSFQVPVHVRYSMNLGDMVEAFVFTGPQFGVAMGNKDLLVASGTGSMTGHALERRWKANGSSLSWNIGIGGIIEETVQVRLSYNMALKNTGELQQIDLVDGTSKVLTSGKAHACQISLSYLF